MTWAIIYFRVLVEFPFTLLRDYIFAAPDRNVFKSTDAFISGR